ncbi:nickel pincer cofactor biosynthesis protein LarC [Thermodesulfobacteriota bacterium]
MIHCYIDCFSGISGDMFLGALLDAGLEEAALRRELDRLDFTGFSLEIQKTNDPFRATRVRVTADCEQPHRRLADIELMISASRIAQPVKEKSLQVFRELARAEAHVHGCGIEEVHFHEVGAVDSIVDIVGSAAGVVLLGLDAITCSPLPMPRGWVDCAHGKLPLPAPAVCEILKGVPVYGVEVDQELVTPTGAAIVKTLSDSFGQLPVMAINEVGYGAGSNTFPDNRPNLLRIVLGQARDVREAQKVEVLETHIDDASPEIFPHVCERLLTAGALDVALIPMQMKKGRPGFLLRVICDQVRSVTLQSIIFSETTAIGLRYRTEKRLTLPRESGWVETDLGRIRVKKVETPTGQKLYPEYDDCRQIASEKGFSLRDVYGAVAKATLDDFIKE